MRQLVATKAQAVILRSERNLDRLTDLRLVNTPKREHWAVWSDVHIGTYRLSGEGLAALALSDVVDSLSMPQARAIKYAAHYSDEWWSMPGWVRTKTALERAGLWSHGSLTEKGRRVREILNAYDVWVG